MQAIFDHLTAILVGATLLGTLIFVQVRQQQAAIDTTVNGRAQEHAGSFFEVAQREIENARTRPQAVAGLGYYVMNIEGTPTQTNRFTFVTSEPAPAGSPAASSSIKTVSYVLKPTGDAIRVGTVDRPTFDVERWSNELDPSTGAAPGTFSLSGLMATDVVGFVVRAYNRSNEQITRAGTSAGYGRPHATNQYNDPVRFEVEIETAARGPEFRAADQRSTSDQNLVRVAHSIRPVNVGATGSSTVAGPAASARDIPLLPGEPAPPAPPPPSPPAPPGPTNPLPPTQNPPATPKPSPPAPNRPAPPPGAEI